MAFVIKAEVRSPRARTFAFTAQKTMSGGKRITVRRTALAKRPLGRSELKRFSDWNDGQPGTELNFKFYRQATNKIAGVSDAAAAWLGGFFWPAGFDL